MRLASANIQPATSVPERQEFFVSSSKMQSRVSEFLSVHFGGYTIRENYKPDWLIVDEGGRLELDFL